MSGEYLATQEKFDRLPAWAKERIRYLEERNSPAVEEIVTLRKKVADLQKIVRTKDDRIAAMVEMFKCAAKGGSEIALAVQGIVEDFLVSDEE